MLSRHVMFDACWCRLPPPSPPICPPPPIRPTCRQVYIRHLWDDLGVNPSRYVLARGSVGDSRYWLFTGCPLFALPSPCSACVRVRVVRWAGCTL